VCSSDLNVPVNLGNPEEIAILDLAKLIKELCNSKSNIVFKPLPKDDPRKRCPDITLAKGVYGWEPKVKLEEGLKKTIEWYKNEIHLARTTV
jgi:nucleoside-diphosphate-sugar epimerase